MKRFCILALAICIVGCRPAPKESPIVQTPTTAPTSAPVVAATEAPSATSESLPKNNMDILGGQEFSAVVSGKEAGNKAFAQLITSSYAYLHQQQEKCIKEFGLGQTDRFDLSQYTGEITFSRQGKPQVIAKFQIVGDVSNKSKTWLWAWANSSLNPDLVTDSVKVAEYGDKQKLEALTTETWPATEADGWAMTAVAAKLLHAKGAYRAPSRQGPLFVIIKSLRRVENKK